MNAHIWQMHDASWRIAMRWSTEEALSSPIFPDVAYPSRKEAEAALCEYQRVAENAAWDEAITTAAIAKVDARARKPAGG